MKSKLPFNGFLKKMSGSRKEIGRFWMVKIHRKIYSGWPMFLMTKLTGKSIQENLKIELS